MWRDIDRSSSSERGEEKERISLTRQKIEVFHTYAFRWLDGGEKMRVRNENVIEAISEWNSWFRCRFVSKIYDGKHWTLTKNIKHQTIRVQNEMLINVKPSRDLKQWCQMILAPYAKRRHEFICILNILYKNNLIYI